MWIFEEGYFHQRGRTGETYTGWRQAVGTSFAAATTQELSEQWGLDVCVTYARKSQRGSRIRGATRTSVSVERWMSYGPSVYCIFVTVVVGDFTCCLFFPAASSAKRPRCQLRPELAHHQGHVPAADIPRAARFPLPLKFRRAF